MLGAHDVELGIAGTFAMNIAIFGLLIAGLWRIERRFDSGQTLIALALIAVVGIVGRILTSRGSRC